MKVVEAMHGAAGNHEDPAGAYLRDRWLTSFVVQAFELPRPTLQITSDVWGFNGPSVLDLLDHTESCEVLQGRLPKPAVHSSRQPV